MADDKIILELQNIILDGAVGSTGGNPSVSSTGQAIPMSSSAGSARLAIGAISAQLLVGGASKILSSSGNQELAKGLNETGKWGFLALRSFSGDPVALVTMAINLIAELAKIVESERIRQEERAAAYNELDMMRMQVGQLVIRSNTEISYNQYGRIKLTDRK